MTRTYSTSCIAPIYTQPWPGLGRGGGCPIPPAAAKRDAVCACAEVSPLAGGFLFGLGFFRGAESFWKGSGFAPSWVQLPSTSSVLQHQSCLVSSSSCCEPHAENWILASHLPQTS